MKLRGPKRYKSGGIACVYHRGSEIKLPAHLPEDHPEFPAAYLAACRHDKTEKPKVVDLMQPKSVADVVGKYLRSPAFRGLSGSYREVRRRDMNRLLKVDDGAVGRVAFASVHPEHVRHQMDRMELNPANERLKSWRALGQFAVERNLITKVPAEGIKQLSRTTTEGFIPWTFADIADYRHHRAYGTESLLAFELQFWAGCRISDTVVARADGDRDKLVGKIQQKCGIAREEAEKQVDDPSSRS